MKEDRQVASFAKRKHGKTGQSRRNIGIIEKHKNSLRQFSYR
jgi:hypothetical protein